MNSEKVIKGLECHRIDNNHRINCADCPYYVDDDNHIRCVNDLHDDTLELLIAQRETIDELISADKALKLLKKEQKAVEPKKAPFPDASRSDGSYYYICGACSKPIDPNDKHCHECGRPVLWESR